MLADRYRLTDSIGRGGMADVYAAEDTSSGDMVAVKIMRMGEQADPQRFAAEMEILDRLSHPAIVQLFDSGTTEDASPYFVMQLVDGDSLSAVLRRDGPLEPEEAADIGARVASALAHAHSTGVIHRDIKPANILVDHDGGAYLTDFGVARLADATLVTRAGTTIGTAAYLAPEQLQDSQVGPEADVYSLGLVLMEALTGRRAFRGTGVEAAMARLSRDPGVPRDLPEPWVRLLVAMTRRAPDRRPSAEEVEAVLRRTTPAPDASGDELGARTYSPTDGDEEETAISPPEGSRGSQEVPWDPPSDNSGQVPPTPPPSRSGRTAGRRRATGPPPDTPPPASPPPGAPAPAMVPAGPSGPSAAGPATTAPEGMPAPAVATADLPSDQRLATADLEAAQHDVAVPMPVPRGFDAIRSRALLVGLALGAIGVLLMLALLTLLVGGGDGDIVVGGDPVDDAVREVIDVVDAAERLSAADPSLQRQLVDLSEDVAESVNADAWDEALLGVVEMTREVRSAVDTLDIDALALDTLLTALRDLTREIEAAAGTGDTQQPDDQ